MHQAPYRSPGPRPRDPRNPRNSCNRHVRPFLALVALLLVARGAPATPLVPDDIFHHDGPEKQFTEFWTGIFTSDTGHIIYLSFLRSNLGLLSGQCGVAVSVTLPDGQVVTDRKALDPEAFREDRASYTIQMENQRLVLGPRAHKVTLDMPRVALDLTFVPTAPGYKYDDGLLQVGPAGRPADDYVKYYFLVPRSRMTGTLRVDGGAPVALRGQGYLEHMVTNRAMTLWSGRWVVTTLLARDFSLQFLSGTPLSGHEYLHDKLGWFALVTKDGPVVLTRRPRLKFRNVEKAIEGCSYATEFLLEAEGERGRVKLTFRKTALHDPYVVLEQLPPIIRRLAAAILGNPVFFRFRNAYDGVIEVDGKKRRVRGEGLHQVVCLRPD